jgi:hypothetical protein
MAMNAFQVLEMKKPAEAGLGDAAEILSINRLLRHIFAAHGKYILQNRSTQEMEEYLEQTD